MDPVRAIDLLRWTLAGLAVLVAGQAALGSLGLFRGGPSAALAGLVALAGLAAAARTGIFSPRRPLLPGWRPIEAGLLAAVVAALATLVWLAAGRGTFTYDSLSFHLYVPASWMHAGRLEIVPMVFGDVAPAYNPSNVELLVHLLMAPLRSGYLAECVQAPFAAVAALAIHATSRELGAPRAAGLAAALAFLLIPEVWVQASVSMVDLALGALYLATLPFLIRLWRAPTRRDLLTLAVAHGLLIGTKFVALPYSGPLLVAYGALLWRHRARLGDPRQTLVGIGQVVTLVLATGGFWYLRNLVVTGNPVFPLDLSWLGLPGLYGSDLMRAWDYHVPVGELGQLGEMLLGGGIGFALAGGVALAVRWRGPELPLALSNLAIFWLWVPYQHSRFLFAFFGVVAIAQATATRAGPAAKPCAVLLGAAIAGALLQSPEPAKLALLGAAGLGALLPAAERRLPLRAAALAAALAFVVAVGAGLPGYRERYPGYTYGPYFESAWRWIHENVSGAHVAYTGSNLPFPLFGKDLANRVAYVNAAGGPHDRVHDFPAERPPTSAEPTPYRKQESAETWLANLDALGCDTLLVTSLFPIVQRNVAHDEEGFPAERAWADARPGRFRLRYATAVVRIYDVLPPPAGARP